MDTAMNRLSRTILGPTATIAQELSLASDLARLLDDRIDQRLAHHGGKLLTQHGEDGPEPNPVLASAGGFLLTLGKQG